jgi:hypothetical protein
VIADAKCSQCGAETELIVSGVPICLTCDGQRESELARRERIGFLLRERLEAARVQGDLASKRFSEIIKDGPNAMPSPDGLFRVERAGQDCREALKEVETAVRNLNEFLLHGTIPPDL